MQSLVEVLSRLVESETRSSNSLVFGTVSHVDPAKQRMRMRLGGEDSDPFLSPWLPYGQTAGAMKVHSPPSVGQQFALMANGGDWRQSVAIPFTWSDENASPSTQGNEHVMTFGSAKIEIRSGEIVVTVPKIRVVCGGASFELTNGGLKMVAPDYDFSS